MDLFREITQTHTIIESETESEPELEPEHNPLPPTSWNIETILLELLFTYNKFCIQLKHRIQSMNDTYAIARYITCTLQALSVLCGFVFRFMFFPETKRAQEPDDSWVNIVCLYRIHNDSAMQPPITHEHFLDTNPYTPDAQYYIEETYRHYKNAGATKPREYSLNCRKGFILGGCFSHEDFDDDIDEPTENAEMNYANACNDASRMLQNKPDIAEIVVWSKDTQRDEQWVKTISPLSLPILQYSRRNDTLYSNVEFLHIDYRHPTLGEVGIEITLPKQLMIVGNELFSPAFLYRWLKYYSNDQFVFDDAYCVYLMDDNVNQHILRYGDYIVLGKTDIQIVRKHNRNAPTLEIKEKEPDETEEPGEPEEEYETVENVRKSNDV